MDSIYICYLEIVEKWDPKNQYNQSEMLSQYTSLSDCISLGSLVTIDYVLCGGWASLGIVEEMYGQTLLNRFVICETYSKKITIWIN